MFINQVIGNQEYTYNNYNPNNQQELFIEIEKLKKELELTNKLLQEKEENIQSLKEIIELLKNKI